MDKGGRKELSKDLAWQRKSRGEEKGTRRLTLVREGQCVLCCVVLMLASSTIGEQRTLYLGKMLVQEPESVKERELSETLREEEGSGTARLFVIVLLGDRKEATEGKTM